MSQKLQILSPKILGELCYFLGAPSWIFFFLFLILLMPGSRQVMFKNVTLNGIRQHFLRLIILGRALMKCN